MTNNNKNNTWILYEEAYKGPFSHSTYLANSKRQIKKNAK